MTLRRPLAALACLAVISAATFVLPKLPAFIGTARGAAPAAMPQASQSEGKRRINLSGRQRMLSQRVAKSACLGSQKVGGRDYRGEMISAAALFETTLAALRAGSAEHELAAETDAAVLQALDNVSAIWIDYKTNVAQLPTLLSDAAGGPALEAIFDISVPLLLDMDLVVSMIEQKYTDTAMVAPLIASVINVAGRQRMLSQKMIKELCMIVSAVQADDTAKSMSGTLALFTSSHERLKRDLGALPLPEGKKREIRDQFAKIEQSWGEISQVLTIATERAAISRPELERIAGVEPELLAKLNDLVGMIETAE